MSDSDYHPLSKDTVFDLLSNSRRRFVLHYLERADGPVRLSTLAAEIAATENEVTVDELTSQQRKRTYVSLYQTHIPKLQDAGAVSYNAETGTVDWLPEPVRSGNTSTNKELIGRGSTTICC